MAMMNDNHIPLYSESFRHGRIRLCKRADSGIWYAIFAAPTGEKNQLRKRTTHTTIKRDAITVADSLTKQLLNRQLGVADGAIPLDKVYDEYFKAKGTIGKDSTRRRIQISISNLNQWIRDTHQRISLARDITPPKIREFRDYRATVCERSHRTVNNDIENLGTVFRWAVKENLVAHNPCDCSRATGRVQLLEEDAPVKRTFTDDQYAALVASAAKAGDRLAHDMIVVFANTGMRFEELAHLTRQCLLWNGPRPVIDVRARNGWSPKDPKEVKRIPMTPEVEGILRKRSRKCKTDTDYLFQNPMQTKYGGSTVAGDNRVSGEPARRLLRKHLRSIGIKPDLDLMWHAFRRFFVKRCIKRGVPLDVLMSWTGHDTVQMALHYAQDVRLEDSCREIMRLTAADRCSESGQDSVKCQNDQKQQMS